MSKRNPPDRERRQLRNLVQNPGVQYRYAIYFFAFAVAAAILNQVFMMRAFRAILIQTLLSTNIDPATLQVAAGAPLQALALRMTFVYPLLGMACAAFAIWITHRFVGPQVTIRRYIGRLQDGDYTSVCRLRGNELEPVAAALNDLARELERRRDDQLRAA